MHKADNSTPTLVVRDLQVLRGKKAILNGVNLNANIGEVCAVMGISGAGKTTVLRAIAALQSFNAGSISIDGVSLRPGSIPPESQLKELRRRVGVVFQSNALFEHLSVLDNVTLAPIHSLKWTRDRANETAHKLLVSLGVDHRALAYPRELSGGEAQRVAIARALAPDPLMLLMDEPTSALDPARRAALGELLRSLAVQGRGLLLVTHDADFAQDWCDRVVVLADGLVVEDGPAKQILAHPTHTATRALLSQAG
ncbi:MAG: ATP-binding cassette domain-containing protein [Gemmatimonadaceae bacterium]